jgi:hypothetical protein
MSIDAGEPLLIFALAEVTLYTIGKSFGHPWLAVSILPAIFIVGGMIAVFVNWKRRRN